MSKKNIRSEYIKQLMEDKEALSSKLEATTKDTLREILSESVNKELRNILNESDEDDFEEEEVTTVEEPEETETETSIKDTEVEDGVEDDVEVDTDTEEELEPSVETEEPVSSEETGEEDVWGDLEDFKGDDGEYDLTGMDKDDVIKVLKVMNPDTDGVRIVKNANGSVTLTDDETDREYLITTDGMQQDTAEEEYEIEMDGFDGIEESVNEGFGCSEDYQEDDVEFDDEYPEDEMDFELDVVCDDDNCQVDEAMTTQEEGPYNRGVSMVHTNTNSKAAKGRNASAGGKKISSTGDNSYSGQQLENIKRKANVIFNENKQLKQILATLKGKLEESIVINASLGKIIQLVTENTTSKEEKVNIVKRFNNVKTIQESRDLYKTISNELKTVHPTSKSQVNEVMDKQIAEAKTNNVIETSIYKSTDLSNTLDLMNRLNKL